MKKILLAAIMAAAIAGTATAGNDDITTPIITNVFTTSVSPSSSSLRAVRIGINSATSRASVIFNQAGYAPVILSNEDGKLTYNGTALTTDTFTGTDMTISQDLSVGRDAAVTRNATIGGTLEVTGASTLASASVTGLTSGATLAMSGASTLLGAVEMGAENTQSTVTATGVATFHTSVTAPALTGSTSVTSPLFIATGGARLYSRTSAQIKALDPGAAGEVVYCSDCATVAVCVSTGTAVADWALITDKSAACE